MITVTDDVILIRRLDVTARRTDEVAQRVQRPEGGVLLETLVGRYVLDRDAATVWLLIDGRRRAGELVKELGAELGLPLEEIAQPVHALCARLLELGLVQVATPADAAATAR